MKRQLEKLNRISRLQTQMRDLEKWRLNTLKLEQEALVQAHREMVDLLGGELASFGPVAAVATRRVRSIEQQIEALAEKFETQAERVVDQAARAKLAEKAVEVTSALHCAQEERKDLAELVERWLGQTKSSPG
jgi:hypothetical protein